MEKKDIKVADSERTVCEVWTRVMGFYRPVSAFNKGKKSEYLDRLCFAEQTGEQCCCRKCA
ncbi:MAG: anaerobic ribonucleoside-triphosphate reductase [Holosporales bacterium]|nr:anaerobic ribonucleoside-triphosphate reductase [Holosporales bacterium]